jgi:hypothetical protein
VCAHVAVVAHCQPRAITLAAKLAAAGENRVSFPRRSLAGFDSTTFRVAKLVSVPDGCCQVVSHQGSLLWSVRLVNSVCSH